MRKQDVLVLGANLSEIKDALEAQILHCHCALMPRTCIGFQIERARSYSYEQQLGFELRAPSNGQIVATNEPGKQRKR